MSKFEGTESAGIQITYRDHHGRTQTKSADEALPDLRRRAVRGSMSLSTPIVSSQDGSRMSGNLGNFGGKRAMPFGKGGKRSKSDKRALALKALKAAQKKDFATQVGTDIDLSYMGFNKLKGSLAAKGASNPGALAAWIGRRKYGAKKFDNAAGKGLKLGKRKK